MAEIRNAKGGVIRELKCIKIIAFPDPCETDEFYRRICANRTFNLKFERLLDVKVSIYTWMRAR